EDLCVHVRVAVHEARGHHMPLGVEHFAGSLPDPTDRDDAAVPHSDVGPVPRQAGPIDHRSVLDHQVVGHARILSLEVTAYRWPRARSAIWTLFFSRSKRSVFSPSTSPTATRLQHASR